MRASPRSPRRQRKALYTADTFTRRRRMTVLLSRELRERFHRRSVPVRKGDTVRVLGGSFKGREERVAKIDHRDYSVTLDNVTLKAADEKMKPLGLKPGRLVITRLNLSDAWRRRSLRIRDEDVTPEERGEAREEEEAGGAPEETPGPSEPEETTPETGRSEEPEAKTESTEPEPTRPRPRRNPPAAPPEENEEA